MPSSSDLLLDTHALVWLLEDDPRLGATARAAIQNARSVRFSAVSVWELVLKQRRGRFVIGPKFVAGVDRSGLEELPVTVTHSLRVAEVNLPHNDPFDAMLVAQAIAEGAALVTADRLLLTAQACPLLDANR